MIILCDDTGNSDSERQQLKFLRGSVVKHLSVLKKRYLNKHQISLKTD